MFLLFVCYACNNKKESSQPENDIDAARNFIRAALDGRFDEARKMMINDSDNVHFLNNAERIYGGMKADDSSSFRAASINIHQILPINDSTTVVIYSNSYKNDHDTLKVIKVNGQWLVDLKYLFEHDTDTIPANTIIKDSLR